MMRWLVRTFAAGTLAFFMSASLPAQVTDAQLDALLTVRDFDRSPVNRSADWAYTMSVVRAGEQAWKFQKNSSGQISKRAFMVRNVLFTFAAREVLRWQYRYCAEPTDDLRFEAKYVHATFLAGLYLKYAGDYWQARDQLWFAANQISSLKQGERIPLYNGQRLDVAISREFDAVSSVLYRHGAEHPYDRISHFGMSDDGMLQRSREAAELVFELGETDPELLEATPPDLPADEPTD